MNHKNIIFTINISVILIFSQFGWFSFRFYVYTIGFYDQNDLNELTRISSDDRPVRRTSVVDGGPIANINDVVVVRRRRNPMEENRCTRKKKIFFGRNRTNENEIEVQNENERRTKNIQLLSFRKQTFVHSAICLLSL